MLGYWPSHWFHVRNWIHKSVVCCNAVIITQGIHIVQHRAFESTGQNPSRDADGSCHPDLGESTFGSTSRPDCINWVSCKYLSSSQSHRDTFMAFVCKLGMMYLALFCTVIIEFTSWSIIYTYIYIYVYNRSTSICCTTGFLDISLKDLPDPRWLYQADPVRHSFQKVWLVPNLYIWAEWGAFPKSPY